MEKYKICPACQTKNPPGLFECINCEADLTSVKITDGDVEEHVEKEEKLSQDQADKMYRVCECGEKNPVNARKCRKCKEDICDITPTLDDQEQCKCTEFLLCSVDGEFAYSIELGEVIIGRDNVMMEYLAKKSYVSRAHAKLMLSDGELFIENLSNTNFTYINNTRIVSKTKLKDGDEIGLGGISINGKYQDKAAYFTVRIGECM